MNVPSIVEAATQKANLAVVAQNLADTNVSEVLAADPFYTSLKAVENIPQTALCDTALDLTKQITLNQFRLGGVLTRIRDEEVWRQDGDGFKSFHRWAELRLGLKTASVSSYMGVFSHLTANGVNYEKVKPIKWSVLRIVAAQLKPATLDAQVQKYSSMTADEAAALPEIAGAKKPAKVDAGKKGGDSKASKHPAKKTKPAESLPDAPAAEFPPSEKPYMPTRAEVEAYHKHHGVKHGVLMLDKLFPGENDTDYAHLGKTLHDGQLAVLLDHVSNTTFVKGFNQTLKSKDSDIRLRVRKDVIEVAPAKAAAAPATVNSATDSTVGATA